MTDVIVLAILALMLGSAVGYLIRAKKRGVKCIGCSAGGGCPHCHGAEEKSGSDGCCCGHGGAAER